MDHYYTSVIYKAEGIDDMLGKLSRGTNVNDNSNCQCLIWPAASGQIVKKLVRVLSIGMHKKVTNCQERHKLPCTLAWPRSTTLCRGPAVLFFRVVSSSQDF